jgi:hypothetical protein
MSEWQPIETAPLSDVYSDDPTTNVLLWNDEFGVQVGYVFLRKNGDVKAMSTGFVNVKFTHWMPLPAKPEPSRSELIP